jgi:hypothetical protein
MLSPCFCLYILFVFGSDTVDFLATDITDRVSAEPSPDPHRRRNRLTLVAQSIFVSRYSIAVRSLPQCSR